MEKLKKILCIALLLLINPHRWVVLVAFEFIALLMSWLSDKFYDISAKLNDFVQEKHIKWPLFGAEKLGFKKVNDENKNSW